MDAIKLGVIYLGRNFGKVWSLDTFDTHAHTHTYLLLLSTSSGYLPVVLRQGEGMICNCDMLARWKYARVAAMDITIVL